MNQLGKYRISDHTLTKSLPWSAPGYYSSLVSSNKMKVQYKKASDIRSHQCPRRQAKLEKVSEFQILPKKAMSGAWTPRPQGRVHKT